MMMAITIFFGKIYEMYLPSLLSRPREIRWIYSVLSLNGGLQEEPNIIITRSSTGKFESDSVISTCVLFVAE